MDISVFGHWTARGEMKVTLYDTPISASEMQDSLVGWFGAAAVTPLDPPQCYEIDLGGSVAVAQPILDRFWCFAVDHTHMRYQHPGHLYQPRRGLPAPDVFQRLAASLPEHLMDRLYLPTEHLLDFPYFGPGWLEISDVTFQSTNRMHEPDLPRHPFSPSTRSAFEMLMDAMATEERCRSELSVESVEISISPPRRSMAVSAIVNRCGDIHFEGWSLAVLREIVTDLCKRHIDSMAIVDAMNACSEKMTFKLSRRIDDPSAAMDWLLSEEGPLGGCAERVASDNEAAASIRDPRTGGSLYFELQAHAATLHLNDSISANTVMRVVSAIQSGVDGNLGLFHKDLAEKFVVPCLCKYCEYMRDGDRPSSLLACYNNGDPVDDSPYERVLLLAARAYGQDAVPALLTSIRNGSLHGSNIHVFAEMLREITGEPIGSRCTTNKGLRKACIQWGRKHEILT